MKKVTYKGKPYFISPSDRKNKQLKVKLPSGKFVHFGDPDMKEFPSTKRGDSYCTRSLGIKGINDPESANFWSRKFLWKCRGKKSMRTFKEAGLEV